MASVTTPVSRRWPRVRCWPSMHSAEAPQTQTSLPRPWTPRARAKSRLHDPVVGPLAPTVPLEGKAACGRGQPLQTLPADAGASARGRTKTYPARRVDGDRLRGAENAESPTALGAAAPPIGAARAPLRCGVSGLPGRQGCSTWNIPGLRNTALRTHSRAARCRGPVCQGRDRRGPRGLAGTVVR
jgi:hypothetical protein